MKPAVFLDRDGTLIEQVHHLTDPGSVRLVSGGADAVKRLRAAGYACVVVTNQSVIGRGMLTVEGLDRVHAVMARQLADQGTVLDGVYFCPAAPVGGDPTVVEDPDRKPGPGMLLRAAQELELDLSRSWMIGDMISDILAGQNAGCMGSILVLTGYGQKIDRSHEAVTGVADDLVGAAELVLRSSAGDGMAIKTKEQQR